MRDLEVNREYVYEWGSEYKKGHGVLRETVTFRVLGKTPDGYTIKFVTLRPAWLSHCDDFIIVGSGMHTLSKLVND